MENRIRHLEKEISELKNRFGKLEHRFTCQPIPDNCTEYKGAVFQKKLGGGYREAIFCLVCGAPMTPAAASTHFLCRHCGHTAEFPGLRVADIILEIPY